ncbi:MAG: voltage-gated potassium channel [Cyclobacteriaceae bacterium]|jgi:voltage-gated potassium channel
MDTSEKIEHGFIGRIKAKLFEVVFGTDTRAGKIFDEVLLVVILGSIVAVMLESVKEFSLAYGEILIALEWTFTGLFTIEYLLRIWITRKPKSYIFSPLGIVDFVALMPSYIAIFVSGGSYLMVIRAIRLLRVFRIFKLTRYLDEAKVLAEAMKGSQRKILIFMGAVSALVVITGTLMYLIEGGENGFTSIPMSIYWAVVTVTTVGYGDIAPQTVLGQSFATLLMLMGYAIIAVPTGIMTSELSKMDKIEKKMKSKDCLICQQNVPKEAKYCSNCGNHFD